MRNCRWDVNSLRFGQSISSLLKPSNGHLHSLSVASISAAISFSSLIKRNSRSPRGVIVCSTLGNFSSKTILLIMPAARRALRRSCSDFMLNPGIALRNSLVRIGFSASSRSISTVHLALIKSSALVIGQMELSQLMIFTDPVRRVAEDLRLSMSL